MSSRAVVISPFHLLSGSYTFWHSLVTSLVPNGHGALHPTGMFTARSPRCLKIDGAAAVLNFAGPLQRMRDEPSHVSVCEATRAHRSPVICLRGSSVWRAAAAALLRKRLCRHIHQWKLGSVVQASAKHKRLTCSQQRLLHACVTAHNQNERKIIFAQHKGCQVFVWQLSQRNSTC
jgi:hypothetical protein